MFNWYPSCLNRQVPLVVRTHTFYLSPRPLFLRLLSSQRSPYLVLRQTDHGDWADFSVEVNSGSTVTREIRKKIGPTTSPCLRGTDDFLRVL